MRWALFVCASLVVATEPSRDDDDFQHLDQSGMGANSIPQTYEEINDAMIRTAESCGRYNMTGDAQGYQKAMQSARNLFAKAVDVDPQNPQAYMTMGQLYLNANELDEAVMMWKGALRRSDRLDQDTKLYVSDKLRYTEYGRISMQRDATYNQGAGNLHDAELFMKEQLRLFPKHPQNHHD